MWPATAHKNPPYARFCLSTATAEVTSFVEIEVGDWMVKVDCVDWLEGDDGVLGEQLWRRRFSCSIMEGRCLCSLGGGVCAFSSSESLGSPSCGACDDLGVRNADMSGCCLC